MNEGVSIIICCYNSSLRIKETLKHIAVQQFSDINCEVILVDNASTDNTAGAAKLAWSETKNTNIDFHIVHEPAPGLSYAREKGTNEANFEFLIFCDDDNWLGENYVQNVYTLFKSNPDVAILGGLGIPEFENPLSKPVWFDKFYHGYAVGPQAEKECIINGVYGAGMAVRKSKLKKAMQLPMFLHDRKRNELMAGGDGEICYRIRLNGYLVLYSPDLTFKHFLISRRLTWDYLKKLHIGFAKMNVVISLYERAINRNNPKLPRFYWLKKAFYYCGIYLKYWPKHYAAYKKGEGSVDEIHHLVWKSTASAYVRYNFQTVRLYQTIFNLKRQNDALIIKDEK